MQKHEVKVAVGPPARALAAAHLASVQIQQVILRNLQEYHWTRGTTQVAMEEVTFHSQMSAAHAVVDQPISFPLHLKRDPASSVTPDFDPVDGFESRQTLRILWRTDLAGTVPALLLDWIKTMAHNTDREGMEWVKGECTSTYVEQKTATGTHYEPRLGMPVKFWSSLF